MGRTATPPRSPIEIECDVTRCAARLRELRAAQAAAPSHNRPRFARDIEATSSRLDRLFEEKRASRVALPTPRPRRSRPIGLREDSLVACRNDRAAGAARVLVDLGDELAEESNIGVAP